MFCNRVLRQWIGGSATTAPIIGTASQRFQFDVNVKQTVLQEAVSEEALKAAQQYYSDSKYVFCPRAEVYSELEKLPLRFALHDFAALQAAAAKSSTGYFAPLGAVDPDDTIPFHAHRDRWGKLEIQLHSMNPRANTPHFFLRMECISGDLFRFEEELIKIFPTKKTFLRNSKVLMYNSGLDATVVLHHWLYGLGF